MHMHIWLVTRHKALSWHTLASSVCVNCAIYIYVQYYWKADRVCNNKPCCNTGDGQQGYLAQGLDDGRPMGGAHVFGQAMKRHAEEGLESAGALLCNEVDLLTPQEAVLGGDDRHGLLQCFYHHGSVALLLLPQA